MSDSNEMEEHLASLSREEMMSALFANIVVQHTNMAFMFMGRMPHPETGKVTQDLESAKFFIDQLEMIEFKTRGNLEKQEEALLKESLTGLRMAFVEAVGTREKAAAAQKTEAPAPGQPAAERPEPQETSGAEPAPPQAGEESRKKFTKKY